MKEMKEKMTKMKLKNESLETKEHHLKIWWLQFKRRHARTAYVIKMGIVTACFFSIGGFLVLMPPPGNLIPNVLGVVLIFLGGCLGIGTSGVLKGIQIEDLENIEMECSNKF